jgi:uncharacterized protein (TIGR02246 family)
VSEQSRITELEQRVALLEARAAIENMHYSYVRALAERNFDGLVDWFTADAVIDMRTHGRKAGRDAIAEHFSHMIHTPLDGASYFVTAPVLEVRGDEASGAWTWHRLYSTVQAAGATVTAWGIWDEGRYDCSYRRDGDGRWRFSSMRFRVVRPRPDDAEVAR